MAKDIDGSDTTSERRERRARTARVQAEPSLNTLSPTPPARAHEAHVPPTAVRARPQAAAAEPERATKSAPSTKSSTGEPASFAALPDRILERYYRIGAKYYLDNGELAFTHRADTLTTPSENAEIVRDLVDIARHNGMQDISVTGTERFRREVWAAATRLSIEVRGYHPTIHDEKQLVRAMAREDAARRGGVDEERAAAPGADGLPAAAVRAAPPAGSSARDVIDPPPRSSGPAADNLRRGSNGGVGRTDAGTPRPGGDPRSASEGRTFAGELLDHGPEHYQRNPREDMSYYVQVGTATGATDLWGLDLKRALAEAKSRPKIGDRVVVRQTGQRDVTVRTREFDDAGRFLGERDKDTHRNRWSIEKEEFVRERARLAAVLRDERVNAERGARAHPQLLGSYFVVKQAEEFAKERFRTLEERRRFIEYTRERLAQIIERGEALPTTQIRNRQPARTRAASRDALAPQGPGATPA